MQVKSTHFSFPIEFTKEEIRVVGLALVGRLKADEDILLARELNQRILEGRKRILDEQALVVANAMDRAGGSDPP
jgi:hypothetical protein